MMRRIQGRRRSEVMTIKSIVTYDGLPKSSGGAHRLRTRNPISAYASIDAFLTCCTSDIYPTRFTIELIDSKFFPSELTKSLRLRFTARFGDPKRRMLGDDFVLEWDMRVEDVGEVLSIIAGLCPLPDHPFGLSLVSLVAGSVFHLMSSSPGKILPNQGAANYLEFEAIPGCKLGESYSHCRISQNSTMCLILSLPFSDTETGLFLDYTTFLADSLPFSFSKSHWKRWTFNRRGDGYIGRKFAYPTQ
jgi:hypothetical protein